MIFINVENISLNSSSFKICSFPHNSVLIFFLLATSDWAIAVERSFSWCCWQTEITPLSFSTSVTSKLPLIRAQRKSSNAESVPLSIPVVLTFPRVLMKMSGYVSSIFSDDSYSTLPDDLLGPAGVHNEVNDPGDDSQHVGQNLKYQEWRVTTNIRRQTDWYSNQDQRHVLMVSILSTGY